MSELLLPVGTALFVWWASTGVVMLLDGLPRRTFRCSMLVTTLLAASALLVLARTSQNDSVAAAYMAFACGVMVWAWQEMSFLTGMVTGPRRRACAPGCGGWRHALHAIEAILYHELAIIAGAVLIAAVTWGGSNLTGLWTYLVLWAMRQSAKLNLHLGVRNTGEEFVPEHLSYITSFFRRRPMNLLFPVSVTAATAVAVWLVQLALAPDLAPGQAVGLMLVASMLALGVIEHWFLVLPLPVDALWRWSLRARGARGANPDAEATRARAVLPTPR